MNESSKDHSHSPFFLAFLQSTICARLFLGVLVVKRSLNLSLPRYCTLLHRNLPSNEFVSVNHQRLHLRVNLIHRILVFSEPAKVTSPRELARPDTGRVSVGICFALCNECDIQIVLLASS
jgi:hypothetical protein